MRGRSRARFHLLIRFFRMAIEIIELYRSGEGSESVDNPSHVMIFAVTGTDDDVRMAWAFARFFRFFLGTLRQVYLPRMEMLDPLANSSP